MVFQIPNHIAISIHGQISLWLAYDGCSHELQSGMPTWTLEYNGPSLDVYRQSWRDVVRVSCWRAPPFHTIVGGGLWSYLSSTACTSSRTGLIQSYFLSLCVAPVGHYYVRSSFRQTLWLFLWCLWFVLVMLRTICWSSRPPQEYTDCPFVTLDMAQQDPCLSFQMGVLFCICIICHTTVSVALWSRHQSAT